MDEARSGPDWESGGNAMGDGGTATQGGASANPGLKQQAMDTVRGARERASTQLRERAESAREGATRMVDERKRTLADSVHALASAFDAAALSLSDGQQGRLADLTRELSGRAHRIATYLEEQDTRALVTDLEGTARQHPAAFLGTTFAAGLAAGRFLRSSTNTHSGVPMTTDQGVDFEFHPDAALLADDSPEAGSFGGSTTGYTASGATGALGTTGGTASGPGSTGATGETFGSRLNETDRSYSASGTGSTGATPGGSTGATTGHIGTGGAAMASRAAGSAPIGSGTGGLNEGGAVGDGLSSPNRDATTDAERSGGREGGLP